MLESHWLACPVTDSITDCLVQSLYEVWHAESECRALQNQSAEHGRVIEQSQSSILEHEKKAERLFATRGQQRQVHFSSCPTFTHCMHSHRHAPLSSTESAGCMSKHAEHLLFKHMPMSANQWHACTHAATHCSCNGHYSPAMHSTSDHGCIVCQAVSDSLRAGCLSS